MAIVKNHGIRFLVTFWFACHCASIGSLYLNRDNPTAITSTRVNRVSLFLKTVAVLAHGIRYAYSGTSLRALAVAQRSPSHWLSQSNSIVSHIMVLLLSAHVFERPFPNNRFIWFLFLLLLV